MVGTYDCNDSAGSGGSQSPSVPEICNGTDDDCDGMTDEGAAAPVALQRDADGDGFGRAATTMVCPGTPGYVTNMDDCFDDDGRVHPYTGTAPFFPTPACPTGSTICTITGSGSDPCPPTLGMPVPTDVLGCDDGTGCSASAAHWDFDCNSTVQFDLQPVSGCDTSGPGWVTCSLATCNGACGASSGYHYDRTTTQHCGALVPGTGGVCRCGMGGFCAGAVPCLPDCTSRFMGMGGTLLRCR